MATSSRSSPISRDGFEKACRYLDTDRPVTAATPLVPSHVCHAVIDALSEPVVAIGEERGMKAIVALLAAYPSAVLKTRSDSEGVDLKTYQRRMAKVFALYGEQDCAAVIRPGTGLPSRLQFLPTEAELKAALDAEVQRRARVLAYARIHLQEAKRRSEEAQREAVLAAERAAMTPEQRAERVREITARLKVQNMDGGEAAA